jgi:hypothetical protein
VVNNELADALVPPGYPATPPGLKEMLTTTKGRGLGYDGVFLDTIDTAAPNSYASNLSPPILSGLPRALPMSSNGCGGTFLTK